MALAEIPLAGVKRIHTYHGEADILEMELTEPFHEKVRPQAKVELYGDGEHSHYQFKHAGPFRLEGILSYQSGYTQVAGHRSTKPGHGYATLTTSVTEGLNILDVVTADRVVAQISTEHPLDGAVPEVSFLGTRFENLRIAGHKVEVNTNLNILGPKPVKDGSYFDQSTVMGDMAKQYNKISADTSLPEWAKKLYPNDNPTWLTKDPITGANIAKCSLVSGVQTNQKSFGHVIEVPHFGKFFLGELQVYRTPAPRNSNEYDCYNFRLTMVRFELGCPTQGSGGNTTADSNGQGGHN
jgi:hypothetical protein